MSVIALAAALLLMQQAAPEDIDWDEAFGVEQVEADPVTGELPVDAYVVTNANAGADPFSSDRMAQAFGGQEGIRAIADRLVAINLADPRIAAIFESHDLVRLRRTLFEQFCYILAAGCDYTGRDMQDSHAALGIQKGDMNALVENLQRAMREADVPFAAQNRFLAKLAPMSPEIIDR